MNLVDCDHAFEPTVPEESLFADWIVVHPVAPLEPTHSDLAKLNREPAMRDCAKKVTCPQLLGTRTWMLHMSGFPSAVFPYEWPKQRPSFWGDEP